MRSEHELTPYAPGRLDGSPALVIAPHPDDEIFGCGGFVARAVAEARDVRTVVLTDGGAQGDPETRRAESREAAEGLGLPEPQFLGFADRDLDPADPRLSNELERVICSAAPSLVLTPSPAELHPDHRAAAVATYRTLARLNDLDSTVLLAAYEVSAVLRPNLLLDVSEVWETVERMAATFASQIETTRYLEIKNAIAIVRCLTLPADVRRAEAYHVVDLGYVRSHTLVEWSISQGPVDGLGADPVTAEARQLRAELNAAQAETNAIRRERDEQRSVLDQLYRSKTWKVHTFFERLKRR